MLEYDTFMQAVTDENAALNRLNGIRNQVGTVTDSDEYQMQLADAYARYNIAASHAKGLMTGGQDQFESGIFSPRKQDNTTTNIQQGTIVEQLYVAAVRQRAARERFLQNRSGANPQNFNVATSKMKALLEIMLAE